MIKNPKFPLPFEKKNLNIYLQSKDLIRFFSSEFS